MAKYCLKCKTRTEVLSTRYVPEKNHIRRIRICKNCGYKFITHEQECKHKKGFFKRIFKLLGLSFFFVINNPSYAVPVIPNFSAGSSISRTTSSQSTREIIQSYSYSTGYQYTTGGSNIEAVTANGTISPEAIAGATQTINGVTSTTTGINLQTKPQWKQTTAGAATQFHESYIGPGLNSYVHIDRSIEVQSVTESTSTFTQ